MTFSTTSRQRRCNVDATLCKRHVPVGIFYYVHEKNIQLIRGGRKNVSAYFTIVLFIFSGPMRLISPFRGSAIYIITKTRLSKYIDNFTTKKDKNSDIFHISSQT